MIMSKKSIIILITFFMIIAVISVIFIINNNNSNNNEPNKIEHRIINTGDFQDIKLLPYNYLVEQAKEDGCIVQDKNDVYNIERFKKFLYNINDNKNDFIRIVNCDDNKVSIVMDIQYDSINSNFIMCFDNTRYKYEAKKDKKYAYYIFKDLVEEETEDMKFYKLKNLVQEIQKEQIKNYESIEAFSIIVLRMPLNT